MNCKVGDIVPLYVYSFWYARETDQVHKSRKMIMARIVDDPRGGPTFVPIGEWREHRIPLNCPYEFYFNIETYPGDSRDDYIDCYCLTPDPDYEKPFLRRCVENLCWEAIEGKRKLKKKGSKKKR